jgi:outer membrane protein OmpA-like peptidoglycan-associated protein
MVPDCRDLELDSPEGSLVNWQGIAIIRPDSTGEQQVRGGVVSTPKKTSAPNIFFSPVYFEYDKTTIDSTGEFSIVNVALYLKQYPDARILISGNTDKHASDTYNDALSKRRCNKVRQILVDEYGIEVGRLEIKPKGKRFLLSPKKDHINRRVDFSVID